MELQEAQKHIELLITGIQKFKSNAIEALGDGELEKSVLGELYPWSFGDDEAKNILKVLQKYSDAKNLTPHDYYNLVTILVMFVPQEYAYCITVNPDINFPLEPETEWLVDGWDDE